MDEKLLERLKALTDEIRLLTLRSIGNLGFGHLGGSYSIAETLAVLYGDVMNIDPKNPQWEDRDMLVCSKGHAGPAIYAALAAKGYFPKEWLDTLNVPGTHLPSHCDRILTPGVDMTTGSLGQGASSAVGMAYANKLMGKNNFTYLILGDGELQEGQVWEAMSFIGHHKLNNIITIVDLNKKQLDGKLEDIMDYNNVAERMVACGLRADETPGHDLYMVNASLRRARLAHKPTCIVLHTTKAKGSIFEDVDANHSVIISKDQFEQGMAALTEGRAWTNG